MAIERSKLKAMYRKMLTIRVFEETLREAYRAGNVTGLVHVYTGQEAIATGVCTALREDDRIVSTHRGHGHCLAKGGDLKLMMAELFGKSAGYCRGRGGSMHLAAFELGVLGANGIVGGGIGLAVGSALTAHLTGSDQVTISFFGDGAADQGSFHESINIAAIWRLPVVFVCENNLYAVSTPQCKRQAITDIADRAMGYGIPGQVVDGNDVIAVYEAARVAIDRARRGEGPSLLECKTYRWYGHGLNEPGTSYRPAQEIAEWRERCPIRRLREHLLAEGLATAKELETMQQQVERQMEEAVRFADESPFPSPEEALDDVYAE